MKKNQFILFFVGFLVLPSIAVYGQKQPVSWNIYVDSLTVKSATIVLSVSIQPGWHLYSQFMDEGGPMPTTFTYEKGQYELFGATHEVGKRTTYHDPTYDMQVSWYANVVTFFQRVRRSVPTTIKGSVDYMVCNNELCMPGTKKFVVVAALPGK